MSDDEEFEAPAADPIDERQVFDNERREGIFSTDVAPILGLSRYGTALSVYRAKRGESEPRPTSLPAWIGQRLEGLVSEMYTAATGSRVRADNLAHIHPQYPWFRTHLDRRVITDPRLIVELKTRNSTRGWGEDGSADIPPDVWCQVQAQLAVVGGRECHVAVLFSNSSFRVFRILPDPDFIAALIPTLEEFWDRVQAGIPPLPTGHDADTAYVNSIAGGTSEVLKPATPEQEALIGRLRLAKANHAQAEAAKKELENQVKLLIGEDADALTGPFGAIWWKRTKPFTKVEWDEVAKVYRSVVEEMFGLIPETVDIGRIRASFDIAEPMYTSTKPGIRRIRYDLYEEA